MLEGVVKGVTHIVRQASKLDEAACFDMHEVLKQRLAEPTVQSILLLAHSKCALGGGDGGKQMIDDLDRYLTEQH